MAMHHFKHAFIAILLVFAADRITVVSAADVPEYPLCIPMKVPVENPTNFLFMVDNMVGEDLLEPLRYLLRSIACYIPDDPRVLNMALSYSETQHVPGKAVIRKELTPDFHRDVKGDIAPASSPCERFKKALGRAPTPFLDLPNVQFMVPIIETAGEEPNCFVKAFQDEFRDDPRKENFYFNGILIGANVSDHSYQSIRLVVPHLELTVNLSRPNLHGDEYMSNVYGSAELVDSVDRLIRNIMDGKNTRDWDESWTPPTTSTVTQMLTSTLALSTSRVESTTGQDSTTTSESPLNITTTILETSTSSRNASTTTLDEEDDIDKFISGFDEEEELQNTTIVTARSDKRAAILWILNTTTSTAEPLESSTVSSKSEVNEYAAHEEPVDGEDLNLAAGSKVDQKNNASDPNGFVDGSDLRKSRREIDANLLIYILLLLLIIWLFCIFLCLIWMFSCAKKKKNKLQDEADERAKLLAPFLESHGSSEGPLEPTAPKLSTESSEEDGDDEWKNIKPAKYTESTASNHSKSEIESEKPVEPNAQFAPVEVSEYENLGDDETHKKTRRERLLNPKRTADLRFD